MWWTKFILLITITVGVTWILAKGLFWIEKNKKTRPEFYKNRGAFQLVVAFLEFFRI